MVEEMLADIRKHVPDCSDRDQLRDYLRRILNKDAFDHKGLIYGLGHAVYTLSDPRAHILKEKAKELARLKGKQKEYQLLLDIEEMGCEMINAKVQSSNRVSANVDFFAGFVLEMLNIPEDLYTPVFAISRIAGWSAHRLEQILDDKIMRPAYVTLSEHKPYTPISER